MNIKKASNIVEQINNVIQNWKHYASQTNVSVELTNSIGKTLLNLKK